MFTSVVALPRANSHIVDPSFLFALTQTFIEIVQSYFGVVSVATLKDRFAVIYQVDPSTFDGGPCRLIPHSFSKRPRTR